MSRNLLRVAVVALTLFAVSPAAASENAAASAPTQPPGADKARYIVFLHPPVSDGKPGRGSAPAPDIKEFGGEEHYGRDEILVVTIPKNAAQRLRDHARVAHMQRIWTGESLEDWDEVTSQSADKRVRSDADDDGKWMTGTFAYDGSGNIKQIGDDVYRYDTAGRLIESVVNGVTETYGYDSFGNLLTKSIADRVFTSRSVDSHSNRLAHESYDAAGNQLTDGVRPMGSPMTTPVASFHYDSYNMMTMAETRIAQTRRMIYTADDERIGTLITENEMRWTLRDFAGKVIREYWGYDGGGDWGWTQDYYYVEGQLIGGTHQFTDGLKRHYHLDHLGSIRLITDASGEKQGRHDFRPFGVEQTSPNYEHTNFERGRLEQMKFTGHQRDFIGWINVDNDEYLDYMHARFYSPSAGRFLSVDPAGGLPLKPQSWNKYAYVQNQPLNFLDPTGAYRTDFHYDLTLMLAVAAGYSLADATEVAKFTELPDHDSRNPERATSFGARAAYHFPSQQRLHSMYVDAMATSGSFYEVGTYLHALQDSYSHRGHGSVLGHIVPLIKGVAVDAVNIAFGNGTIGATGPGYAESYEVDTTSARPALAMDAARATYDELLRFSGKKPKVGFSAIASSVHGYLAADEHSVLRRFYADRLKKQLGIP